MRAPVRDGLYAELGNGVRLHYAESGDAGRPLVVCLHGFPEYWAAWEDVLPLLGARYHAVAPDLRGFNLSSQPAGVESYRPREIVADVVRLIDRLGHERAFVVGHDWGGAIAWQVAIAQPARVRRLAILNAPHPVPFARELAHNPAQQQASAYMNWLRAGGSEAALARDDFALLERFLRGAPDGAAWLDAARLARYRAAWRRGIGGGINYYRASPLYPPAPGDPGAAALQLDAAAFRVDVPTLVLWGMRDTALLPGVLDGLDEVVPDLRIERLDHATHWLAHEEPQFVADRVLAFFDAAEMGAGTS